ncbi:hypothetical protein DFH11DRAFT_1511717 [Phellopilus nigrolimitatus]|nr:hypothetical protein DFH11DRAFT_1511717 [Phellopilus nigrolimitatus]
MSFTTASDSTRDSSVPHTPPTSSVITAVKASLGSPFFHARLQEGQRIDEADASDVHYEVSAFAISLSGTSSARSLPPAKQFLTSGCEGQPRGSRGLVAEKSARGARSSRSSRTTPRASLSQQPAKIRSPSAVAATMPYAADDQDFWAMVADAQNPAPPASRHYHYLTRSQSVDAGTHQHSPKLRKQNASYSPAYGTPMYQPDHVEHGPVSSGVTAGWPPARGRHLSPIEEVQFFSEKHGDTASLNSATSAQSNLFINRPVRRTPSTSTFNSAHSTAPRSPEDTNGTSPSRTYANPRSFPALPVIPASPRESQNVFEPDPVPLDVSERSPTLTFPLPAGYPPAMEYAAFQPPEEQDLGEMTFPPPRVSILHSRTPSLLSRSESVRTELTYLTAQDSAAASRRASAAPGEDIEAARRRSPLVDGDTTLVDPSTKRPSTAARLKASIDTFLKSPRKVPEAPTAESAHPSEKWFAQLHANLKTHAPWRGGKPAEVLFWTGFLAPWCWLIGGWMLARSGHTMAEGLPSGAKEGPILPVHNPSSPHLQSHHEKSREQTPGLPSEKNGAPAASTSMWEAAKNSSADLLASLRGDRAREDADSRSKSRQGQIRGDVSMLVETRMDPWVSRCRVAAVLSGMLILALCIVALIVLVRSL